MAAQLLVKYLNMLGRNDVQTLKWHLEQGVGDYEEFPHGLLEEAESREAVVSCMIEKCGKDGAGRLTVLVLRQMNKNNLATKLEYELVPGGPPCSKIPERKTECSPEVGFVEKHEAELIQRVSLVEPLADDLKLLLGEEKYANILLPTTSQDRMRKLYSFMQGRKLKEEFYKSLMKHERYLVEDLASK